MTGGKREERLGYIEKENRSDKQNKPFEVNYGPMERTDSISPK